MDSRAQQIVFVGFVIALVMCSMEMMPGWGIFDLEWPRWVFYTIMGVVGAVAGFVGMEEYRIPGLIAGPVVGIGALIASAMLLERVESVHSGAIVLVELVGAVPGLLLFWVLRTVQDKFLADANSQQ